MYDKDERHDLATSPKKVKTKADLKDAVESKEIVAVEL